MLWTNIVTYNIDCVQNIRPSIFVDDRENVHIVGQENFYVNELNEGGVPWPPIFGQRIAYRRFIKGSSRFENLLPKDRNVSAIPDCDSNNPNIIGDNDGNLYVVYQVNMDGNTEIFCRKWSVVSGLWEPAKRITYADGLSEKPVVDMDIEGHLNIFWQDNRTGTFKICHKIINRDLKILLDDFQVTESLSNSVEPKVAIDKNNNIHILFLSNDDV
jgi:hypothetical protein